MITITNKTEAAKNLMEAFKSGDDNKMQAAWESFHESVAAEISEKFEGIENANDVAVMAQRGIRQLTNDERKFYEKWIETAKSGNPKQAFTDLITVEGMPETIIEDVYRDLVEDHPLLARVNFQNVKYLTKWLLNDHTADKAIWGEINATITKQIESSFKTIDIVQGKLSAYVVLAKDMLDLGPNFLDNYVRTILKEAMALGLEYGIISGIGIKGEPIGLIRDIHEGVTVNTSTGYPEKTAVKVTDFTPASYGNVLATLAKTEKGKARKFGTVQLIVNQTDYLTKIMPATTVLNANANYVRDIFPFPTEVIISNAVEDDEAILCLLPEYFIGVGMSKNANIEYSDDFKFLEDKRTYKAKMHAFGRANDNTCAIKLDISKLDPAYIMVKKVDEEIASA